MLKRCCGIVCYDATTSFQRRCNDVTLQWRWNDVAATLCVCWEDPDRNQVLRTLSMWWSTNCFFFVMSPPFGEWCKGHTSIVLRLFVHPSPSASGVSNLSLRFTGGASVSYGHISSWIELTCNLYHTVNDFVYKKCMMTVCYYKTIDFLCSINDDCIVHQTLAESDNFGECCTYFLTHSHCILV